MVCCGNDLVWFGMHACTHVLDFQTHNQMLILQYRDVDRPKVGGATVREQPVSECRPPSACGHHRDQPVPQPSHRLLFHRCMFAAVVFVLPSVLCEQCYGHWRGVMHGVGKNNRMVRYFQRNGKILPSHAQLAWSESVIPRAVARSRSMSMISPLLRSR